MVNAFRAFRAGRWVLIAAISAAYATVGFGCGHEHHDDDYNRAAYHDRYYGHQDYDHHDWDHDRDRY